RALVEAGSRLALPTDDALLPELQRLVAVADAADVAAKGGAAPNATGADASVAALARARALLDPERDEGDGLGDGEGGDDTAEARRFEAAMAAMAALPLKHPEEASLALRILVLRWQERAAAALVLPEAPLDALEALAGESDALGEEAEKLRVYLPLHSRLARVRRWRKRAGALLAVVVSSSASTAAVGGSSADGGGGATAGNGGSGNSAGAEAQELLRAAAELRTSGLPEEAAIREKLAEGSAWIESVQTAIAAAAARTELMDDGSSSGSCIESGWPDPAAVEALAENAASLLLPPGIDSAVRWWLRSVQALRRAGASSGSGSDSGAGIVAMDTGNGSHSDETEEVLRPVIDEGEALQRQGNASSDGGDGGNGGNGGSAAVFVRNTVGRMLLQLKAVAWRAAARCAVGGTCGVLPMPLQKAEGLLVEADAMAAAAAASAASRTAAAVQASPEYAALASAVAAARALSVAAAAALRDTWPLPPLPAGAAAGKADPADAAAWAAALETVLKSLGVAADALQAGSEPLGLVCPEEIELGMRRVAVDWMRRAASAGILCGGAPVDAAELSRLAAESSSIGTSSSGGGEGAAAVAERIDALAAAVAAWRGRVAEATLPPAGHVAVGGARAAGLVTPALLAALLADDVLKAVRLPEEETARLRQLADRAACWERLARALLLEASSEEQAVAVAGLPDFDANAVNGVGVDGAVRVGAMLAYAAQHGVPGRLWGVALAEWAARACMLADAAAAAEGGVAPATAAAMVGGNTAAAAMVGGNTAAAAAAALRAVGADGAGLLEERRALLQG
ncbi:unnamed protein product, partial [Phaeothamnion confervicola]